MASRAEIVEAVEGLATHCRAPVMGPTERAAWLQDWCTDLSPYSLNTIRAACLKWRRGDNPKFPTPGAMLQLCEQLERTEKRGDKRQEWSRASDEEYHAMTLDEKIRHQQILASEARRMAGPQCINRRPALVEEMPDRWHYWRGQAANHDKEAAFLLAKKREARAREAPRPSLMHDLAKKIGAAQEGLS